jgi:hypothetical protein
LHQQSKVPEVALQILNAISAGAPDYPDTLAATVEVAWEIIELRHLKTGKRAVVRRSKPDAPAAIPGATGNASAPLADYPHQLWSRQVMLVIWQLDFSGPSRYVPREES